VQIPDYLRPLLIHVYAISFAIRLLSQIYWGTTTPERLRGMENPSCLVPIPFQHLHSAEPIWGKILETLLHEKVPSKKRKD
jgi:hypothetical protein